MVKPSTEDKLLQKLVGGILDIIIVEYIFHTEILRSEFFEGRNILLN